MTASASTSHQSRENLFAHLYIGGERCPWCDQPIPHEKFTEISSRIETRERERFAEITRSLNDQHARDSAKWQAEIERIKGQAAANEAAWRADERAKTLALSQTEIAEVQRARMAAEAEAQTLKETQEAALNARLAEQRETLERDKTNALNAKDAEHFKEAQKHTAKLAELQRQLEKKTADELGEGAEVDLFEELKAEFRGDLIERLTKREGGADIRHSVMHNGKECGIIVYDSKNRNAWRDEYVNKLARDQQAARAEYAILSTCKFPAKKSQVHLDGGVIIANPARVLVLAQIIREHMIHVHSLRLSNTERAKKTASLYEFITSKRCTQLFDTIDTHAQDLLALQQKEMKAHEACWKQQGTLLRSIQKVRADLGFEIERIIGTAEAEE
jgi:hypothetical protein